MQYRFIDIGKISPYYSVALFESIANQVAKNKSKETLLFWRVNRECIYLGYHQYVKDEINEEFCKDNNILIVRRILGGGCGFCDENQILYSLIGKEGNFIPYDIKNAYKKVLNGVIIALNDLGFNAEFNEKRNAIYCLGKKISGNAQYRNNGVALINGSFLLDFNFDKMNKALKFPAKNLLVDKAEEGMITLMQLFDNRKINIANIKITLKRGFEKALGVKFKKGKLKLEERKIAKELEKKYKTKEWTYRMDLKREKL